ncbi:MAG TPA: hypothetical protein V6D11_10575 [Waterburya sp.]|jgi:uncharacterized repeat protein (TIGR01451 family)
MQFVNRLTSIIERSHLGWLIGGTFLVFAANSSPADANVTIVREEFTTSTAYGWTVGGNFIPCLTATGTSVQGSIPTCGTTADVPGSGALRLTDTRRDLRSFVFYDYAIPANQGLVITFDYFAYGGSTLPSGADGAAFFLFDGSTNQPVYGAEGGALGYAQQVSTTENQNGLTNAYLGIGLDEFGNFANDYEGRGNGCPNQSPFGGGPGLSPPQAQIKDSVTVRGPGNGQNGYCFLRNTGTLASRPGGFSLDNPTAPSRTVPNTRRRVRLTLSTNNTVTLEIDPTGTGTAFQTVLNAFPAPANRPNSFKFGFASSTGEGVNFHELINLQIETLATPPLPDLAITKTHSGNFIQGGTGSYTLRVQNLPTATGPTYGPVTIRDTLPAGFSFASATGTDWRCSAVGQEVTCVYDGPAVNPGNSLPDLTLNVNVTAPPGTYINQGQVATQGDSNATNNTTQDSTQVVTPGQPNLRLVKRITNVTRGGVPLTNVNFSGFVDDPADTNDNAPGWSQQAPVGVFQLGIENTLQPNDEVEYTVYVLSDGGSPANNINFCDLIPTGTSFVPGSLQSVIGRTPIQGNALSPLAPLPQGNACSNQSNPNGAVLVNLGNISNVAGSNFGLVRFRVRVD